MQQPLWPGHKISLPKPSADDAHCRAELRRYYHAFGMVKSVKAKDEDSVYTQYYDYTEPVAKIPGHRILALDRGEREGFLKVSIAVETERAGGIVAGCSPAKRPAAKAPSLWMPPPATLQPPHSSQP